MTPLKHPPKRPLTALLIAPDDEMREAILDGRKTITIREGIREYAPGDLVMICCHLVPWCVQATITSVDYLLVSEVPDDVCREDGFKDNADMLKGMKRYYKNLTAESAVTVIRWKDAKGRLVDDWNGGDSAA